MESTVEPISEKVVSMSAFRRGDRISEGGYSVISSAYDGSGKLQVLREMKSDYRFKFKQKKRFLEGIKIRRLCGQHPHIVQYRAHGSPFMGLPFEVIEHVPGQSMKDMIITQNPYIERYPGFILQQCMMGMLQVHQSGYLHLDIKPENFIVYIENDRPMVKLTDFDLSLPIDIDKTPPKYGGSPSYMAPEYLKYKLVSPATDIFALGVLAYQLYTYRMPYEGTIFDLPGYKLNYPHECSDKLTDQIKNFIEKCMAENSDSRFQDGGEMYVALENIKREEIHRAAKLRRESKTQ